MLLSLLPLFCQPVTLVQQRVEKHRKASPDQTKAALLSLFGSRICKVQAGLVLDSRLYLPKTFLFPRVEGRPFSWIDRLC